MLRLLATPAAALSARRLTALLLLFLSGPAHGPAEAAELYVDGSLNQGLEYDTNVDLDEDGDDDFGSRTRVGATLGTRTPATDLSLDGEVRVARFLDRSDLNSVDGTLDGQGVWNWPRTTLSLGAGAVIDTTREVLDTETSRFIDENERRLTLSARSSIDHQLTRLQSGGLSLSYRERIFPSLSSQEAEALGLEEFSFLGATATTGRRLSPALTLRGSLGSSYFDSDDEETITVQTQVGTDYALTPALRIDGNVGPTFADTSAKEPGGTSGSTVGALWDVNLGYQPSADASFGVGVFQELDPQSVDGALNFRTGITSTFDYDLTRYTSFGLSTLIQRQDPIEGGGETRYFARAQPGLTFRVLPRVRLSTSYRFRWETFDDGGGATSNAVFVNLTYDLPSLLTSR